MLADEPDGGHGPRFRAAAARQSSNTAPVRLCAFLRTCQFHIERTRFLSRRGRRAFKFTRNDTGLRLLAHESLQHLDVVFGPGSRLRRLLCHWDFLCESKKPCWAHSPIVPRFAGRRGLAAAGDSPARPRSTRRRIASEREPLHSRAAQTSILSINSCGRRAPTKGPTGGRPAPGLRLRLIVFIEIDFGIIPFIIISEPGKCLQHSPGSDHRNLRERFPWLTRSYHIPNCVLQHRHRAARLRCLS